MASTDKIPTLDLFSGIGGFSYALRPVCRTVAYSEIDPECREVLRTLMRKRRLDSAPIYEDVRAFPSRLPPGTPAPVVVTGGFPCQNISSAGQKAGIRRGNESGLFYAMASIFCRLPSVKMVVLENTPDLVKRGWDRVSKKLVECGFDHIAYGIFRAAEVGAPHRRARFYCVACKGRPTQILSTFARLKMPDPGYSWSISREPFSRLLKRPGQAYHRKEVKRCEMLGNAVVPATTAYACQQLSRALLGRLLPVSSQSPGAIIVFHNKKKYYVARTPCPGVGLLVPFPTPLKMVIGKKVHEHDAWMTPTHTTWHQYRTLTPRALTKLSNQIYYDSFECHPCTHGVRIEDRSRFCAINPRFIEYLMGYPKDWTLP